MKKLIAVLVVLLFAAPALAADWAFYGSQRIGTWYTEREYPGDSSAYGGSSDAATQMYFQGNSRLGAKVKADKVTGQIELALGAGGDVGDTSVATRRAYGVWKISDFTSLKIGKDYSPVTDFISNQWYSSDNDLLGEGNFYGRRPGGITLMLGNFELAALVPTYGADLNTTATGINGATGNTDPDSYIPRFEASYNLKLGAGYIKPFGGFQYYTVKQGASTTVTDDLDVLSWVAGLSTNWNIGAFSIGGQLSYGANQGNVNGWSTGSQARSVASAYLDTGGDDIKDVNTLQALLVAGLKFTDTLRFEIGAGYRADDADDVSGVNKDELWAVYLQAMVTMAPGVYL
ncbi:hypothetical protein EG831_10255, partial [bacterium]|nr:hypothetical protein [bacterium]